jgi:hypothetical protein
MRNGATARAALYLAASVVLGLLSVRLGVLAGQRW